VMVAYFLRPPAPMTITSFSGIWLICNLMHSSTQHNSRAQLLSRSSYSITAFGKVKANIMEISDVLAPAYASSANA